MAFSFFKEKNHIEKDNGIHHQFDFYYINYKIFKSWNIFVSTSYYRHFVI